MIRSDQILTLEAVKGPRQLAVHLDPDGPHPIGRGEGSSVHLTDVGNIISRRQAQVAVENHGGTRLWCVTALSDRIPTQLNGIALAPGRAVPLQESDLITIGPWTLIAVTGEESSIRRHQTLDDRETGTSVRSVRQEDLPALGRDWLRPLLKLAEQLHLADNKKRLADAVADALAEATRFGNVAYTGPLGADGSVDLLALRTADNSDASAFRFSRTVLREASAGQVVHRTQTGMPVDIQVSMVSLDISEAICVPIRSGDVVVGLIYMDNRHGPRQAATAVAEDLAFAVVIGRLASLAMRALMHRELDARLATFQAELAAAAKVQRLILPPSEALVNNCDYAGRSDAGQVMCGDFFDVIALPDRRVVVAIADSCGKGIVASVLATLVQGFLRGTLGAGGTVAEAAHALNEYLAGRGDTGRFLTVWMAVIDPAAERMEYLDAGHGFALLARHGEPAAELARAGGPPLGAISGVQYDTAVVAFPRGSMLVLASDGVIEQPDPGVNDRFGMERFRSAVDPSRSPAAIVAEVLGAVRAFAAVPSLADDATVVALRCLPGDS